MLLLQSLKNLNPFKPQEQSSFVSSFFSRTEILLNFTTSALQSVEEAAKPIGSYNPDKTSFLKQMLAGNFIY